MKYEFCPNCGYENSIVETVKTETFDIDGTIISVPSKVNFCTNCILEFCTLSETFAVLELAKYLSKIQNKELDSFNVERTFNISEELNKLGSIVNFDADASNISDEVMILYAMRFINETVDYTKPSEEIRWLYNIINLLLSVYDDTTIHLTPTIKQLKIIKIDNITGKLMIQFPDGV